MCIEDIMAEMQPYNKWAPTSLDTKGRGCPDRQDWIVHPCIRTRDSDAIERSNFTVAWDDMEDEEHAEIHRFGHWACGWVEIILVKPGTGAHRKAAECMSAMEDYPILCDEHLSEVESEEANLVWESMFAEERIEYIRSNRSEFDFTSMQDLMGCVRGHYFAGEPSNLLY